MTVNRMQAARHALGLSLVEMADWLGLERAERERGIEGRRAGDAGAKRVAEMESGRREITGPIATCLDAFLAGYRPGGPALDLQDLRKLVDALSGLQAEGAAATAKGVRMMHAGERDEAWKLAGEGAGLARAVTILTMVLARMIPDELRPALVGSAGAGSPPGA